VSAPLDPDPWNWLQFAFGWLFAGGLAVAAGAIKQLWTAVGVLHKRIDDNAAKLDTSDATTDLLIDKRHLENLAAINALRSELEADRKASFDSRLAMTEKLASMASRNDLNEQIDRLIRAIAPRQPQSWGTPANAVATPDTAD
jgi:hypothetical protein